MRLLRSYLFAPGNRPSLLEKVFVAGADAVVLDLEDAVPFSEKAAARLAVAAVLSRPGGLPGPPPPGSPAVFVRLNSLDSTHWREDVDAVVVPGVSGVRVPKAESLDALCRLNDALSKREDQAGMAVGSVKVVATVETARGLVGLDDIGRAPRLCGFTFGAADYGADVGGDSAEDRVTLFARSALVLASRHRRLLPPIASVYTRLQDDAGLREDTVGQKRLGFFGRSAIHPRQLPIIHEVFSPSAEEVAAAQGVVSAYEAALADGRGALQTAGHFVDLAIVRRARATMALHHALGKDQE